MTPDYTRRSTSDLADSVSYATSTTTSTSESSRKSHYASRSRQFTNKHGSKVHAFETAKAPWPFSYDKASLELEMMDTALTSAFKGVVSLVNHRGKEPARCLDVGTGLGLWVTNAAHYWKQSTFVGFDLVDVQIPLSILDPDEASRIEWVHGNVLTGPLPFDDEEFDHVRLTQVALGIPENKWQAVFEEIRRVMKQGATIEIIDEDAMFPVLPRWFTEPLHARTRWPSISISMRDEQFSHPQITTNPDIAHEYELLEILFNKVFDRRFINTRPSSTLPASFSTYFGHVISPPVLTVPMPPLPPVQSRPPPRSSHASSRDSMYGDRSLLYDAEAHGEISLATFKVASRKRNGKNGTRSVRPSTSAASPSMSAGAATSPVATNPLVRSYSDNPPRTSEKGSSSASLVGSAHTHGYANENGPSHATPPSASAPPTMIVSASGAPISGSGRKSARASGEVRCSRSYSGSSIASMASKRTAAIQDLAAQSTTIGARTEIEMFPVDALLMFDVHSLCLHLRRALGFVLAIREAMWEELQCVYTSPSPDVDLERYGFFPHEDTMESLRAKYDQLLESYKSDMHVRLSLWHSLVHFGWDYPQRDPMSKAEEMEEARLREDILAARRKAGAEKEREPPCRAVRMLVGAKV